jgi:capsule polysaccharide export protein KpsC/LpsZ
MTSLTKITTGGSLAKFIASTRSKLTGTPTYVVGFSTWKLYLRKYFPDRNLHFLDKNITETEFNASWSRKIKSSAKSEIFVWGFKVPDFIVEFSKANNVKLVYVEDGFIRSVKLGAQKAPAMSLTLDPKTPYFNAQQASTLEDLLNTFDFEKAPELIARARSAIKLIVENGVSKYNNSQNIDIAAVYGEKSSRRVLVVGQVEDDASIKFGCEKPFTNNDLVRLAAKENPGAQILYKPHPDVLSGNREYASQPADVANIAQVIVKDFPLSQAFHGVDHVYTITSLSGFEALLRGIKVTTVGAPFYSGWGITDDRQKTDRRTQTRSLEEVFAAAYILYSQYFDADSGKTIEIENVIRNIIASRPRGVAAKSAASTFFLKAKAPAAKAAVAKAAPAAKTTSPAKAGAAAKPAAAAKPVATIDYSKVPDWFRSKPGAELQSALATDKPIFLYIPWIAGHGDALISKIQSENDYNLVPFDFVEGIEHNSTRLAVLDFSNNSPALYRKMLLNRLIPLKNSITALVFTFDWSPVMRIIVSVAQELQIPTILVPHESVFVDRSKYYWDVASLASVPRADLVLGWGGLQKEIFVERGYPEERFIAVGAPKFDTHVNYKPQLTKEQFCQIFGLSTERKTILFASQPLDSQLDKKQAQISQRAAITDLFAYCQEFNHQLLIRLPPNKADILTANFRDMLNASEFAAVDDGTCYLVSPEESIYQSDAVTSINSTMLFEAALLGRPSLSLKYVEFEQIWEEAGIPAARDAAELREHLSLMLDGEYSLPQEGMAWAANMFGVGDFDGQAATRIKAYFRSIGQQPATLTRQRTALDRLLAREQLDVIAIPSKPEAFDATQKYLIPMLNARSCVSTFNQNFNLKKLTAVEVFFQWGITESENKIRQRATARELGRPVVIIEDGFIRSIDIGLSAEPGLSVLLDDRTAYYDATKVSKLESIIESQPLLTSSVHERCTQAIQKIVQNRVSKYNHAPDVALKIGEPSRKKILLVDQRYGDQSVGSGLGSDALFERMLSDALREYKDYDIIIKQHPDAIKGGKSSYFNNEKLAFAQYTDNVHPILFDVNPYSLFDIVDKVFVMTSGMGFEALMAGKEVRCYGMPFYAGWGLTEDIQQLERRTRRATLEEVFHTAYIQLSRYFNPEENRTVEVEELTDYIVKKRGW